MPSKSRPLHRKPELMAPAGDWASLRAALKAAGDTKSTIKVFPDAQHGFNADYRASYDETAAKAGWADMLAWFKAHGVA